MVMTVSKFFSVKMKKKLVKTCLFQNKYLSLQRTLVVKDHWADIGQASNRLPTLQSLSLNLKLKSLGKGVAVNPCPRVYPKIKFRLEHSCANS